MKKSILSALLFASILSQPACTERITGKGSISKVTEVKPEQSKFEISIESSNPQLEIESRVGDITLINRASCGDQDVTNQIARVRPEFSFFKDSKLNEGILTSGPTAVLGLWVSSSDTGKMLPTAKNFIPVGISKAFATKTNLRPGTVLKELYGLELTTGAKDIEGALANALSVYNSSMGNGFATATHNQRRIYTGIMTCNQLNQNLNPTPNIPSVLHQMKFFNLQLPQGLNASNFKGRKIPETLFIKYDFSGEKITQISSGVKLEGAVADESFGARSLVNVARDLIQASSYQGLRGESVQLLQAVQDLLREKRPCQSLSSSLPDGDKKWWSDSFAFDREMNLGMACRILAGSDMSTESMLSNLASRYAELKDELSHRMFRAAIWTSVARLIPANWSTESDLRCFANSGLYINRVLSSVVLPLKKYQGGFSIRGVISANSSHPEGNLAHYATTNALYFDARQSPNGESRGDLKTVFGMYNIHSLAADGGALKANGFSEFDAKDSEFSVEMAIGESLVVPSGANLLTSPLNINFTNRALQVLPNGERNNCGEIGAVFCLKQIGGIIRGLIF